MTLLACDGAGLSEQEMLQKARDFLEQGELQAASIELRNTLQQNSENAEARYLLGEINLDIGDFSSAVKDFKKAASAGLKDGKAQIGIARALVAQQQFRTLLDEIEIKDTWPESARADLLGLRAAAEASLGDLELAMATIAEGAKLDPDAFFILKAKAIFQLTSKETDAAYSTLNHALSIFPDNSELLLLIATTELQRQNVTNAKSTYRNVIEMDKPTLVTAHGRQARISLAKLQVLNNDLEQAKTTIAPLLQRNKNDPEANYLSGVVAFGQGEYAAAEEHARTLLEIAPNNQPSQKLMGRTKYALKAYDQAAHHLSTYLNAVPSDLAMRKLLASAYLALRQPDLAKSTLEPVLLSNPDDSGILFLMSQLKLGSGDTQGGIQELRKAVDASPDNHELRKQLVNAYIIAGDTDQAIRELQIFRDKSNKTEEADNLIIVAYLRAGEFDKAINLAQEMLSKKPQDPGVITLVGSLYAASGDLAQARRYFDKALTVESNFAAAITGLARIEGMEGNNDRATELYRQLVESGKGGTDPMVALAELAEKQGHTQVMLEWLEKARESAPDDVKSRMILANYYLKNKQPDKAGILVQEAIRILPAEPVLLAMHGRVLVAQKRYNEALNPLNKLVRQQPDSPDVRALLGEAYMRLGMTGNAREHLGKALENNSDHALALVHMAEIELQAGQVENSLSYARRLQQAHPTLYFGYSLDGDAQMAVKDYGKAQTAYRRAWELQQTAGLAMKLYNASKRSGNTDGAVQALKTWLGDHPDDVSSRVFLASAYQNMGLDDLAVPEYEKVLETAPDNGPALNNLAWLYSLSGNPKAVQLAERAYRATPEDPAVQDTYGWILVKQGQPDKGLRLLKQAMEKLPGVAEVRYHHAVALLESGSEKEGKQLLTKLLDEGTAFDGREEAQRLLAK